MHWQHRDAFVSCDTKELDAEQKVTGCKDNGSVLSLPGLF